MRARVAHEHRWDLPNLRMVGKERSTYVGNIYRLPKKKKEKKKKKKRQTRGRDRERQSRKVGVSSFPGFGLAACIMLIIRHILPVPVPWRLA